MKRISENKGKKLSLVKLDNGCVVCSSHVPNKDGYIRMYVGKDSPQRSKFLHRLVWEAANGDIPEGYEIDHKCRNRMCCNIEHLQMLTVKQHKTKTNIERYRERIDSVCFDIDEGALSVNEIAIKNGVTEDYVKRYKRELSKR